MKFNYVSTFSGEGQLLIIGFVFVRNAVKPFTMLDFLRKSKQFNIKE